MGNSSADLSSSISNLQRHITHRFSYLTPSGCTVLSSRFWCFDALKKTRDVGVHFVVLAVEYEALTHRISVLEILLYLLSHLAFLPSIAR